MKQLRLANETDEMDRPAFSGSVDEITTAQLFHLYMSKHANVNTRAPHESKALYRRYFARFARKPIATITRFELLKWHRDIGTKHGKTAANRALELFSAIFNIGLNWDLITSRNPATGVSKFKLPKRDRFLQAHELPKFLNSLNNLKNGTLRDFLLLCLWTGARRSNVQIMRWNEIDWAREVWRIKMTKNGEPQHLPLSSKALEILQRRYHTARGQWVLPSPTKRGPIGCNSRQWEKILNDADISDLRVHDLRRTLASWEAITGASLPIIAQTLNHKDYQSTAIYARLNVEPVRKAMDIAINAMLEYCPKNELAKSPLKSPGKQRVKMPLEVAKRNLISELTM